MKKNLYLFQPQYSEYHNGKWRHWLPYSVACLWTYAIQFDDIRDNWHLAALGFKRENFDDVIDRMHDPAFCGFSCYLWNEKYNLALAEKIKTRWPSCVISFGGPQVSSDYLQHDFIDIIMLGEGEQAFVNLLRSIDQKQTINKLWPKARIENLQDLPVVYRSGIFDDIFAQNPDALFNAVVETNRGCPFSCTFCDWGSLTYAKIKKFDLEKITSELDWLSRAPISALHLADANFGIFKERDMEIAKLFKKCCEANSTIDYVNVTYTKNSNETVYQIAKELSPYSKAVTISMQSMSDDTLVAIKRSNMALNDLKEHLALSKKYDVNTYSEMILGLPEETTESWKTGFANLLEAGQHNQIDVYWALLIRNSELNSPASRFKYGIKSIPVDEYMVFAMQNVDDPYPEWAEIIAETNTMSREDMIESYMYSWLITNFHNVGYSQIISQFCRHVWNVSYRQYYDCLFDLVRGHESPVGHEYLTMERGLQQLLTTGRMEEIKIGINHISFYHYIELYKKKDILVECALEAARKFGKIDPSIESLQKQFVFDMHRPKSQPIELSYDLDTWLPTTVTYEIRQRMEKTNFNYNTMILQRRRGHLKNQLIKISHDS